MYSSAGSTWAGAAGLCVRIHLPAMLSLRTAMPFGYALFNFLCVYTGRWQLYLLGIRLERRRYGSPGCLL